MSSRTSGGCPGSSDRTCAARPVPTGRTVPAELASRALAGRTTRWLLLAASVAGGLLIAAMTLHLAGPWVGFHHSG